MKNKLKIGLALGSGGARGLAHIGVLKVLEKNNIDIDFIAGSSIGAMVGAYYAATKDIKSLEKIALETNWRTSLSLFDPSWKGGLMKGEKIEKLIDSWLKNINFNKLRIPLTVIATDLNSGEEVNFTKGDLAKLVRGSISVPLIFQPVKYKKYLLADGGLSNPLPDNVVRDMGADFVIAVSLDTVYLPKELKGASSSLMQVSLRSINIMRHYLSYYSAKCADIIIDPKVKENGIIGWNRFFDRKEVKKTIKLGEKSAEKQIPQILDILQSH